ncbi:MAG: hypothetical protein HQL81_06915 [Magnetococcales bacterium]|nr:hypothetical protein [Magnetococcales bacterium]
MTLSARQRAFSIINKLVPDIQKTAELIKEIAASSREQSQGAGQINQAIQQLDQVIQQNAGASEEMAATAEELRSQAELMNQTMSFFNIGHREKAASRKTQKPKSGSKTQIAHGAKPGTRVAHVGKHSVESSPRKPEGVVMKIGPEKHSDEEFESF